MNLSTFRGRVDILRNNALIDRAYHGPVSQGLAERRKLLALSKEELAALQGPRDRAEVPAITLEGIKAQLRDAAIPQGDGLTDYLPREYSKPRAPREGSELYKGQRAQAYQASQATPVFAHVEPRRAKGL